MAKRVPLGAIGVHRDGKTVYPEIGKVFDFTDAELSEINALQKASGNDLIRKPVNEDLGAAAEEEVKQAATKSTGKAAKGGKSAAGEGEDL